MTTSHYKRLMKGKGKAMKKIEYPKIEVILSREDVDEINTLIDRDTMAKGIPAEVDRRYCNKCPKCGAFFNKWNKFCSDCGQRLKFVDNDVIPFDSEEVTA